MPSACAEDKVPERPQATEVEFRRVVKQICPTCGEAFDSSEEAREHWLQQHFQAIKGESSSSSAEPLEDPATQTAPTTAKAKLVEADDGGCPAIVRHKDISSGVARTVVMNEDGSQRAFGEDTVSSLLAQDQEKVSTWMSSMSDRLLRGVVNEMSERFFELQDRVVQRQKDLEEQSRNLSLAFFELPEGCKEKDLDNAYRRLARSMHPDKNGGTEDAKERFQTMRAKYEELKDQFAQGLMERSPAGGEPCARPEQEEQPQEEQMQPEATQPEAAPQPETQAAPEPEAVPQPLQQPEVEAGCPARDTQSSRKAAGSGGNATDSAPQAAQSSEEQTFYCRSRDVKVLQQATFKILQQMKMLQQNLQMLNREFEKLEKKDGRR